MAFHFSQKLSISPQASVRLTLATLLYSGKSPDGHHILVSVIQSHQLRVSLYVRALLSPLCVWLISEQCQIPAQGASSTNCTSHQRFPQSAFHHWLQSHHPASGKNILWSHSEFREGSLVLFLHHMLTCLLCPRLKIRRSKRQPPRYFPNILYSVLSKNTFFVANASRVEANIVRYASGTE